jgi:hypothetical protein
MVGRIAAGGIRHINYIDRSNLGIAAPVLKAEVKGRVSIYRHEGGASIF